MTIYKIDTERNMITTEGRPVIMATKTTAGWRWFTHVGRVGKRMDFKTSEDALRGAAKVIGIKL